MGRLKRRKVLRKIFIIAFFLVLTTDSAFADWQKPELRFSECYRVMAKYDNENLFIQRLEGVFLYDIKDKNISFEVSPFLEGRLTRSSEWERKLAGVELGLNIFPWVYWGEAFQRAWVYDFGDATEMESKLIFHHRLFSICSKDLEGFLFQEHKYNLSHGDHMRNESGLGFIYPVVKHLEAKLNWRHIDNIHAFDRDTFEITATLIF